uniref:hypothetical protein n=1 Tax=Thaumasiovibrio occultus TaxID=1891184 RepID=UPI000B3616BA|nr:hypothetical protein [Thaumasiovibrio occultus]
MEFNKSLLASIALPVLLSACSTPDNTAASCFDDELFQSGKTYHYTDQYVMEMFDTYGVDVAVRVKEQGAITVLDVEYHSRTSHPGTGTNDEFVYRFDKARNQFGFISRENERSKTTADPINVIVDFTAQVGESTAFSVTHQFVDKETGEVRPTSFDATVTFQEIAPLSTALGEFESCVFVHESELATSTYWYRRDDGVLLKRQNVGNGMTAVRVLTAIEST